MMLYTEQIKTAMKIAYAAHQGQTDKGGMPYIYHPIHLAEQCTTETEITAALLHDVVEDSEWTFEQLRQEGISEEVLTILQILTHRDGEKYMDYIDRILENPTAVHIKILDMTHNMDASRLDPDNRSAAEYFQKKYREPWKKLQETAGRKQQEM